MPEEEVSKKESNMQLDLSSPEKIADSMKKMDAIVGEKTKGFENAEKAITDKSNSFKSKEEFEAGQPEIKKLTEERDSKYKELKDVKNYFIQQMDKRQIDLKSTIGDEKADPNQKDAAKSQHEMLENKIAEMKEDPSPKVKPRELINDKKDPQIEPQENAERKPRVTMKGLGQKQEIPAETDTGKDEKKAHEKEIGENFFDMLMKIGGALVQAAFFGKAAVDEGRSKVENVAAQANKNSGLDQINLENKGSKKEGKSNQVSTPEADAALSVGKENHMTPAANKEIEAFPKNKSAYASSHAAGEAPKPEPKQESPLNKGYQTSIKTPEPVKTNKLN